MATVATAATAAGVGVGAGVAAIGAAGEKIVAEVTAKRSVNIIIRNESDKTLDKPTWGMNHGHAASDGLPPKEVYGNTDKEQQTIPSQIRFVKARLSLVGCEGVLTYRYNSGIGSDSELGYVAIKFIVPYYGKNRCTLAILDNKEYNEHSEDRALFEYISRSKLQDKKNKKLIDKVKSKGGKWMEIEDKAKDLTFACTMSGEDKAVIQLVVRTIERPSKNKDVPASTDQPSEDKDASVYVSTQLASENTDSTASTSQPAENEVPPTSKEQQFEDEVSL